ncbi:MAG TPA: tripartite tricarboxylate transporter TctB family protein [Syntrophorhabdales bacterium]|nr:tripartite tricarboxylate transporter TctB family protein [Syntrophorhabdales bacterium]
MGKSDRVSGSFWFLFCLFIIYQSYKLGLGNVYQPGPGFLFFWTGIVVAIMALVVVAQSFRVKPQEEAAEAPAGKRTVTKVILVLVALFIYAALMEYLGFFIVTLLLFFFLLKVIEKKKWWFAAAVSILVTFFSYLIFETALQSQLPKGILGFLRF